MPEKPKPPQRDSYPDRTARDWAAEIVDPQFRPKVEWEEKPSLRYRETAWNELKSFDSVIGYPQAVNDAKVLVRNLQHSGFARSAGILRPTRLMIFGDPGTGKTTMAQAISYALHCNMIQFNADDAWGATTEETLDNIDKFFEFARERSEDLSKLNPPQSLFLFMDEVDSLILSRDREKMTGDQIAVGEKIRRGLDSLDIEKYSNVVTCLTSNSPGIMDEAARRRFPNRIQMDKPEPIKDTDKVAAIFLDYIKRSIGRWENQRKEEIQRHGSTDKPAFLFSKEINDAAGFFVKLEPSRSAESYGEEGRKHARVFARLAIRSEGKTKKDSLAPSEIEFIVRNVQLRKFSDWIEKQDRGESISDDPITVQDILDEIDMYKNVKTSGLHLGG